MATTLALPNSCASVDHAAPASRASWCGQLRLGDLCIPVKAYAAIATPPETPLRQLHSVCGERIEYRKWCPKHGVVPAEEITKGYPYQPDQYVLLSSNELAHLQDEDDKMLHLNHSIDPSDIDLALMAGRTLYLAAANPAAQRPLTSVLQAIEQSGKWGIGRVVFSGKRQTVLVRPEDHVLMVHTLYHPSLRRAFSHGSIGDVKISVKELRPLHRVINSGKGSIPWDDFRDKTDQRLAALVAEKVRPQKARPSASSNSKPRPARRSKSRRASRPATTAARSRRKAT